jgi:hypothetical protein
LTELHSTTFHKNVLLVGRFHLVFDHCNAPFSSNHFGLKQRPTSMAKMMVTSDAVSSCILFMHL